MSIVTSRRRSTAEPLLAMLRERAVAAQPDTDAIASLLREAQAGNAESFGSLYDLHVELVYAYAYYYSGNKEVTETVTRVTFDHARQRISYAGAQGESFAGWLLSIARTQVSLCAGTTDPYRAIARLDNAEADTVLSAVQGLHLPQREAIFLLTIMCLDIPDIAFAMRRSAGQVTNLLLTSLVALMRTLHM